MMSHSLGTNLEIWNLQRRALAADYCLLRYDIRGHGSTSAPVGPYSMELLVEDALKLLDLLNIDQVHWVGISMGGMVGQGVALDSPQRLQSLTLCSTASQVTESSRQLWKVRVESGSRFSMHDVVDHTMKLSFTEHYRKSQKAACEEFRQRYLSNSLTGYLGCTSAILDCNFTERLKEIQTPTLVLGGDQDLAVPLSNSEQLHQDIANSKLKIIAGSAHYPNIEQPDQFNQFLLNFLNSN